MTNVQRIVALPFFLLVGGLALVNLGTVGGLAGIAVIGAGFVLVAGWKRSA